MKLNVLIRNDGKLIGTAVYSTDENSDVHAIIRPKDDHTIHEIEVPDEYKHIDAEELHKLIRSIHLKDHCK